MMSHVVPLCANGQLVVNYCMHETIQQDLCMI